MLLIPLLPSASAVEPCYGWEQPNVVEGPRISVEYDDLVDETGARRILDAGEAALDVYDGLGFRLPVGHPSISVETDPLGRGGFATTEACGDEFHSKLYVYEGALPVDGGESTTAHELFHAVQYGYDPSSEFTLLFAVWPWWAEATANWAEAQAWPDRTGHHAALIRYLDNGRLALHQDLTALLDPTRQSFLYATSMVAFTLADREGPQAIRDTLEVGVRTPGELAWFPDVLAELGIDFDAFWADHLARLPTVDHAFGRDLGVQPVPRSSLRAVPDRVDSEPTLAPQGLGWALHRIEPDVPVGTPLSVTFRGAAGPRWHVVLVTARRDRPGAPHTPVFTGVTDGATPLEATIDLVDPLWIVVSPEIDSDEGQSYRITLDEAGAGARSEGCGCRTPTAGPPWWALGLGLLWIRRRTSQG